VVDVAGQAGGEDQAKEAAGREAPAEGVRRLAAKEEVRGAKEVGATAAAVVAVADWAEEEVEEEAAAMGTEEGTEVKAGACLESQNNGSRGNSGTQDADLEATGFEEKTGCEAWGDATVEAGWA